MLLLLRASPPIDNSFGKFMSTESNFKINTYEVILDIGVYIELHCKNFLVMKLLNYQKKEEVTLDVQYGSNLIFANFATTHKPTEK